MKKAAITLIALIFMLSSAYAKYEASNNDVAPVVLYGKNGTTLVPIKVDSTGSIGGIYSPSAWVDCVATAGSDSSVCSGVTTTTTGSITSGTKSLVVASATGWTVGMGIAVANAGTGGNTELISYVTAVTGTTLTLNDNAVTTANSQTVNHDDTMALSTAIQSGKNVHLRAGTYNVTSEIAISTALWIDGDGVRGRNVANGETLTTMGTVINNRGSSNNIFRITIGDTELSHLSIEQATTVTHTAGYAIIISGGTKKINIRIQDMTIYKTFGGISIGEGATGTALNISYFKNISIFNRGSSTSSRGIFINNPTPNGDLYWDSVNILSTAALGYGVYITAADTQEFSNLKLNAQDTGVKIDDSNGNSSFQRFSNTSCEGASNTSGTVGCIDISSSAADTVFGLVFTGTECYTTNTNGYCIGVFNRARNVVVDGMTNHGNGGAVLFKNTDGNGTASNIECDGTTNCVTLSASVPPKNINISNIICNSNVTNCVTNPSGVKSVIYSNAFNNNANIGIGTVNPPAMLDVEGTASMLNLALFNGPGNVGLNTTAPGQKLDVQGTIRFNGIRTFNTNQIKASVKSSANQACNTTCSSGGCLVGEDTSVLGSFVDCADATADRCICLDGAGG